MTRMSYPAPNSQLDILAQEILQWNRQINLVTRVDTKRRLESLLQHCCQAWHLVQAELEEEACFATATYLDLGSGAGLPGLVWSLARQALGHRGSGHPGGTTDQAGLVPATDGPAARSGTGPGQRGPLG
jgi:hypothetical protein